MRARRHRFRAALVGLALAGCAHGPTGEEGRPPFPLTDAAPHVEPDLVGAVHRVKRGETVYRIARTYGITPRELLEVNDLRDPRQLAVGMELFIPGATRSMEVPALPAGALPEREEVEPPAPGPEQVRLRWPVRGVLYSRFGMRQGERHDGIDISAPEGTLVGAAADGTVLYTGRQSGYGWIVILRHEGAFVTLYAHASAILVNQGDRVKAGQPIARVGTSGRTSGPHLHFEVREGTRPRNPLFFLP